MKKLLSALALLALGGSAAAAPRCPSVDLIRDDFSRFPLLAIWRASSKVSILPSCWKSRGL